MQWYKHIIIVQKPTLVVELRYEPFCLPVVWVHDPTAIGSVALRKGPRRFCSHRSICCHALMFTCQNSPLWQGCERCSNVLSSFRPPWLARTSSIEQRDHHDMCINWNELQVVAYNYTSSLALWTTLKYELMVGQDAETAKDPIEPATRSAVATWTRIKKH